MCGIIAATTATPREAQAPAGRRLKKGPSALLTDPVDQARRIQQRCCLVPKLLDVECDFEALLVKPGASASVRCASYSRGLIKPATNFGQISFDCRFD